LYYLESLQLKGFRNYHNEQLQFHPRLNLVIGENAQGKTNLLESIYYLSVTRSFRTNRDQELANFEDRYFYLKGSFIKDDLKHVVQASYRQNDQLKISVNSNQADRFDHLQSFPVVVFSPDDLQIIRDGPAVRRRFLNLEGSRLNPLYFEDLKNYQRILMQRNFLLKEKRYHPKIRDYLEPWDQALADLGSSIISSRLVLIEAIEKEASIFFETMTGSFEELTLSYSSTIDFCENPETTRNNFLRTLSEKRDAELKRGTTIIGPHLDDLKVMINGSDSRRYSSQGQKRTAALALKMAEVSLFRMRNNDSPIILLDDVFSEFDNSRKGYLLKFIREIAGQCFISTATDLNGLIEKNNSDYKIITVKQGSAFDETDQFST